MTRKINDINPCVNPACGMTPKPQYVFVEWKYRAVRDKWLGQSSSLGSGKHTQFHQGATDMNADFPAELVPPNCKDLRVVDGRVEFLRAPNLWSLVTYLLDPRCHSRDEIIFYYRHIANAAECEWRKTAKSHYPMAIFINKKPYEDACRNADACADWGEKGAAE